MEMAKFGKRIKELRIYAGLNQRSVAEAAGISSAYLSKIENGIMPPPGEEIIEKLAGILAVNKDELLVIAGKVPSDIASQIKNNPEILNAFREKSNRDVMREEISGKGSFGEKLRGLREAAGYSQGELAERIGVSFTYLSKIENGAKPAPSQRVIEKLAGVLKVDVDELTTAAGRIPYNIMKSLQDQENIKTIRKNMNVKKEHKDTRRTRVMGAMKSLLSNKLSRVAIPLLLVIAVAGSLWFAAPTTTKALQMEIQNKAKGYNSLPYTFSVTVTIESGELLPIDDVSLKIVNPTDTQYMAEYNGLPVTNGENYYYSDTLTGTVNLTAYVSTENEATGTGYVVWDGQGYALGEDVSGYGPSVITYYVIYTPPAAWPAGTYNIDAAIKANETNTFATQSSFELAAATMVAKVSLTDNATDDQDRSSYFTLYIDDIVNPDTGDTVTINGGLGSYEAQLVFPDGDVEVLNVVGTTASGPISFDPETGILSVASMAVQSQPLNTPIADIYVRLTGSALSPDRINVVFNKIVSVNDPNEDVPAEEVINVGLLRGDANFDGDVKIGDALRIARFRAELEPLSNIMTVNSASVLHDTDTNDNLKIGDALAIAQYRAELKDDYFIDVQ